MYSSIRILENFILLLDVDITEGVFMFGIFKSNPQKKIKRMLQRKYAESVQLQRNGNLREYGQVMKEIEKLERELEELQKNA